MKKSEIKIGETYVGKNSRRRRVVGQGGRAYASQTDCDTVEYADADNNAKSNKGMTRASFAAWAVSVAS